MSIRKPVIRKPKVPKIKKPLISKRKRVVKKVSTRSIRRMKTISSNKKSVVHKKTSFKTPKGTCYLKKNCKGILSRNVTNAQCKDKGGKSWKKMDGACESL